MRTFNLVLKLLVRNLKFQRKKYLLALISIIAGFMSINLFEAYMKRAKELFDEGYRDRLSYGDILIHHKDAFKDSVFFDGEHFIDENSDQAVRDILKQIPGTAGVTRRLSFTGTLMNSTSSLQVLGEGLDVTEARQIRGEKWAWNVSSGIPLRENSTDTILGLELGKLMNCSAKPELRYMGPQGGYIPKERQMNCPDKKLQLTGQTIAGRVNSVSLEVAGLSNMLYREIDARFLQVPLEVAQNFLGTRAISLICVKLESGVNQKDWLHELQKRLDQSGLPMTVSPWKENAFGEMYRQSVSFLNVLRVFFLTVILTIVLFSVMATQNRLVLERTKEIATLRSLGFKRGFIHLVFATEAIGLSLLGSTVGWLLSIVVSFLTKKLGLFYLVGIFSEPIPFQFSLGLKIGLVSTTLILLLSLLAVLVPLKKAMGRSISESFSKT